MARGALFELKPERAMVTMIPWFRIFSFRPVCPLLYNLSFCCALPSPAKLNSSGHCLVERTILKTAGTIKSEACHHEVCPMGETWHAEGCGLAFVLYLVVHDDDQASKESDETVVFSNM
jgi:hypothetical protein